jgi:predicted TIM-barrel fold metal-dependent hydrolase
VKLSGACRNGTVGRGRQVALDAMPLLRAAFSLDRPVWGSDWPLTQSEQSVDYGRPREALDASLRDRDERRVVLVDTP